MTRALTFLSLAGFAAALVTRSVDPIIPPIAADLREDPHLVALLSTAFSIPFALVPPVLGPMGDIFGKVRLIKLSLVVLIASGVAAALATNFQLLLVSRVVAGMAAGGVFPLILAVFGDLLPIKERHVGIGRLLSVVITGNLLGATLSGLVADFAGWRAVFVVITLAACIGFTGVTLGLRGVELPAVPLLDWKKVPSSYRSIFVNPRAKFVIAAVFLEGVAIFGLLPYVALLLHAAGEERSSIAGLLIGGFSMGGLIYSLVILRVLNRLEPVHIMMFGAVCGSLALAGLAFQPSWPVQLAAFVLLGCGFYTVHSYIQVQSTELSATARGAALALHASFFFLGHGCGPVLYGLAFTFIGVMPALFLGALCILAVGLVVRFRLGPREMREGP